MGKGEAGAERGRGRGAEGERETHREKHREGDRDRERGAHVQSFIPLLLLSHFSLSLSTSQPLFDLLCACDSRLAVTPAALPAPSMLPRRASRAVRSGPSCATASQSACRSCHRADACTLATADRCVAWTRCTTRWIRTTWLPTEQSSSTLRASAN